MENHIKWWNKLPEWKKQKLSEDEFWIKSESMSSEQIKTLYLKIDY